MDFTNIEKIAALVFIICITALMSIITSIITSVVVKAIDFNISYFSIFNLVFLSLVSILSYRYGGRVIKDSLSKKHKEKNYSGSTLWEFLLFSPFFLFPVFTTIIAMFVPLLVISYWSNEYIVDIMEVSFDSAFLVSFFLLFIVLIKILSFIHESLLVPYLKEHNF